ncbi:MAG: hypothetical protein IPH58_00985 [Sphingobacteriales bacterium]|nr:hypothetical protein [Sphingobacteriales bacterium]
MDSSRWIVKQKRKELKHTQEDLGFLGSKVISVPASRILQLFQGNFAKEHQKVRIFALKTTKPNVRNLFNQSFKY